MSAHHLQGIDVLGAYAKHGGIKPLGLRQTALLMQLERLRESLRDVQRVRL